LDRSKFADAIGWETGSQRRSSYLVRSDAEGSKRGPSVGFVRRGATHVLGPLPLLYRVIVSVCTLLSFAGLGAWIGYLMPDTLVAEIGTGIGLGLGVAAVLLLVHDSTGGHGRRTPVRHRAPRL
jgi:hypothetical protein